MKQSDDKGSFSTNIADDVLKEALAAVEKRTGGGEEGAEVPVEAAAEAPSAPPADEQAGKVAELEQQLEFSMTKGRELAGKLKDEHEKLLRAVADLDNFKKRALKEKDEVQRFGIEKLLKDFLPVYDNFDRALDAAKSPDDFDSLKKGVEMIRKLFEDTLGKHGVKVFSSKGQPFDPNRHEAMSATETTEFPPNHVHTEMLRGFTLNDRLVRAALVIISKAPAPAEAAPSSESSTTSSPEGEHN